VERERAEINLADIVVWYRRPHVDRRPQLKITLLKSFLDELTRLFALQIFKLYSIWNWFRSWKWFFSHNGSKGDTETFSCSKRQRRVKGGTINIPKPCFIAYKSCSTL